MKKWTCSILSFILLTISALSPTSESSFKDDIISKAVSFFLGIDSRKASKEIYIDLVPEEIPQNMQIEIDNINVSILKEDFKVKKINTVLIYHTHTDEAFLKGDQDYVETSVGRTKDQDYSIVKVGDKLKTDLQNFGFNVVHDKTDNVENGFYNAYDTSYNTIKNYFGKVDIYVDMHRDAYGGKEPNFIENNGKEYAYIAFVVANGENYTYKPNWQENYKIAKLLTDKLNELCPGVAKKIIFKDKRFNQHVSDACLLIEMGNEKNNLQQVQASAELVAQAFSQVFN
ncbi:MAG: hypothetical protein E7365_01825 [Clostridiales bacterium]|nr:hypothetical protein [Clostridiales bacterium]